MSKKSDRKTALEERLRQSAPPLRPPDPVRAARACARVVSAAPASPLREPRTFLRPLLRVAACLALLFGIALLMRPRTQPATALPALPSVATFRDLTDLMETQNLANALSAEASNLAADLAGLTTALNERSFSILF